jgi:hypothetical protein
MDYELKHYEQLNPEQFEKDWGLSVMWLEIEEEYLELRIDADLRQRIEAEARETFGTGRLPRRWRRCYEIAGMSMLRRHLPNGSVLVHGNAIMVERGYNAWLSVFRDHAWIELPDGRVWDPVTCEIWAADEWERCARPTVHARYSKLESAKLFLRVGYGPESSPLP